MEKCKSFQQAKDYFVGKKLSGALPLKNVNKRLIDSSDDLILHDLEVNSTLEQAESNKSIKLLKKSTSEETENCLIESKINSLTKVIINVGGDKHEILWKNLDNVTNSRLGKLKKAFKSDPTRALEYCDGYDEKNNEFFFDKNSRCFSSIIEFHRFGKLHFMEDVCIRYFQDDLTYWGINEFNLDECCFHRYNTKKSDVAEEINKNEDQILSK